MATHHLAHWACSLKYSDLPKEVVRSAVESLYNWAGCAIGGSDHPAVSIANQALSPFYGAPTCTVLGHRGLSKTDPQHAALLNGIASHVHDYDDTFLDAVIHPTGPVASALLAIAEWKGGVCGEELLLALVVGVEAACKVGLSVWPDHYDVGWHITGTTGSIGAACAVSKLLSIPVDQTAHAIGIAAAQVTGLREMFGTDTKSFHVGRAAQNGVLAAMLARNGFTSSEQALEAKRGWAHVVGFTKPHVARDLDKFIGVESAQKFGVGLAAPGDEKNEASGRWEILRNSFKPYPCGVVVHPVIDACSQLRSELLAKGKSVADIAQVYMRVHPLVIELTGKRNPKDGLEAKFSAYYGAAIGLLFGKGGLAEYTDEVARDPAVVDLMARLDAEVDMGVAADAVIIDMKMRDGQVINKTLLHSIGSVDCPMTKDQLTMKFKDQCTKALGDTVDQSSQALWQIADSTDVSQITRML